MINTLKKIVPVSFKKQYWRYLKKRRKAAKKKIKFDGQTPKEAFTFIYETNHWSGRDSISGGGSDLQHTQTVIKTINNLIIELNLKSVLDIPCGDFAWMQHVDLSTVNYIGGDIVNALVEKNNENFSKQGNLNFKVLDLANDKLPKKDIIINRDCLVHLSFKDIFKAIDNIKKSGCKYLLTTTFPDHKINTDITTGDWRPLNLEEAPFNFYPPIKLINEQYKNPKYSGKSLALWDIESIAVLNSTYLL